MQEFVQAINSTCVKTWHTGKEPQSRRLRLSEVQGELRKLVERWFETGPDLRIMLRDHPELSQRLKQGETTFYPSSSGRGYLEWRPVISGSSGMGPSRSALEYFLMLITNPLWELLGGPCHRCGDYFLRKTKRQKVYCSRTCSSGQTAASTMKKKRAAERDAKIRKAQASVAEWSKRKRRVAWKKWVEAETGLTIFWLTRAVNSGWIKAPETEEALAKVGRS